MRSSNESEFNETADRQHPYVFLLLRDKVFPRLSFPNFVRTTLFVVLGIRFRGGENGSMAVFFFGWGS